MRHILASLALIAFALYMTWGYLNSTLEVRDPATFIGLVIVIGLPLLGAALIARRHAAAQSGHANQPQGPSVEAQLLQLAAARGGRLTAVEAAIHIAITPEAATAALDRLALRGQAAYEVTDAGVIVYSFHDIIHLDGKHTAKGVLED